MTASLAFRGVALERGGRRLFDRVSFALGPGDAALVTGPNGVGKSSLVRVAAGLLRPAAGLVEGDGERALLTEASALDGDLPLRRALRFWARLDGRADGLDAALAALDLAPLAGVPVRLLSTGQRRRAGLVRIVAGGAPVWLLDEPANGLDGRAVGLLEEIVARHRAAGGIALVATHLPIALPAAWEIRLGSEV